MRTTISAQGFSRTAAIDTFVRDEVRSNLDLFSDSITSVDMFMKDINGPKGGVDKEALIRVKLRNGRLLALYSRDDNLYAAIKSAVKRMKRVVRRSLSKGRRTRKFRFKRWIDDQDTNQAVSS